MRKNLFIPLLILCNAAFGQITPERVVTPFDYYTMLSNTPGISRDVKLLKFTMINPQNPGDQVDLEITPAFNSNNIITSISSNKINPYMPVYGPLRSMNLTNSGNDYVYRFETFDSLEKKWIPKKETGRFNAAGMDTAWTIEADYEGTGLQITYKISKVYDSNNRLIRSKRIEYIDGEPSVFTQTRTIVYGTNNQFFSDNTTDFDDEPEEQITYVYKSGKLDSTFMKGLFGYPTFVGSFIDIGASKYHYDSTGNADTILFKSSEKNYSYKLSFKKSGPSSGISEIREHVSVSLYPNPASSSIRLLSTDINLDGYSAEIYDVAGKKLMNKAGGAHEDIHIAHLAPGIYFVGIFNENSHHKLLKFIKH